MKLWIPGPTEVRPEVLAECARPMIGHRAPEMRELIARLDPHLTHAFGLDPSSSAHLAAHTCSATGLMEASLRGVGDRVLCLIAGAFGRRWFKIAQALGKDAHSLEVPMGAAVEPDDLASYLENAPAFDAVTLVSNETSTGVRHPLAGIAAAMSRHPETMLLVDLVSYIAGAPVDFDTHGIDFALAGTQKAFAVPPGITVGCASDRYLARARERDSGSYYLDPVLIVEGHEARKTPSTPAIPLYYALARQLEDITAGVTVQENVSGAAAWNARFEKHARMQRSTARWAARHGLELLPAPEHQSPTVSCVKAGELDVPAFLAALEERGHKVSNGYGDLKNKTFRIGHMGDHTEADLGQLLGAADEVLAAAPA
jgi:aspartate aminotransferase-like enzyme